MRIRILTKFLPVFSSALVFACSSADYQAPVTDAPKNYYAKPAPSYQAPSYQPQYQYQGQYQRPPQPYYYNAPASRYYSDPYAIPPAQYQQPYYDADQYYVPPAYYGGEALQPGQPGFFIGAAGTN